MLEGFGARLKVELHYGMIQSKMLRPYSISYSLIMRATNRYPLRYTQKGRVHHASQGPIMPAGATHPPVCLISSAS